MGIDGIGKGGGAPGVGAPTGATAPKAADAVERPFEVKATEATTTVDATSPLGRLRAGEIGVEQYVDLKVDEATRGLEGLPKADLESIRSMLRARVAEDPALVDLVRSATGKAPHPPEE